MTQQQWGPAPRGRRGTYGAPWAQSGNPWGRPAAGRGPLAGFGPQQGLPQYAPAPFSPPPPRRRSPLRGLVLAMFTVGLLAVGGLALTNSVQPAADAPYQNDDYRVPPPDRNPPPLPQPQTYREAEQLVTDNQLYAQSTPDPVRCTAQPIDVATADDAQLKSHFEALMACTVRVWEPPVTEAGYQIVRPTVTIYGRDITTRCGKAEVNAFYCSADQQVYFSNLLPDYVSIVKRNKWAADVVMAHEFGHAVQARTGILISANALGQNADSKSAELEMSRRVETQADCFAGMFTRAVSESLGIQASDRAGIEDTFSAVGDDVLTRNPDVVGNHGRAASRRHWGDAGLGSSTVSTCNTFTANRSLVR